MQYGCLMPTMGPLANVDSVTRIARRAEELGYAWIAIPDHVVVPRTMEPNYPYSRSGAFARAGMPFLDPLSSLSYLAGVTERVRLLTSILVVPHRPAVVTAKQLASADRFSRGRIELGIGVGWMREEFEAIGAPDFDARGAVTDEYLDAFRTLWNAENESPEFHGRHVDFPPVEFLPTPVQQPGLPVWVGGESAPALRRTVARGDVWYPVGNNPRFPMDTAERYTRRRDRLFGLAEEGGRDPASLTLAYWANWPMWQRRDAIDGGRHAFTGSEDEVASDIAAWRQMGVTRLMINTFVPDESEFLERLEWFMAEVAAKVAD